MKTVIWIVPKHTLKAVKVTTNGSEEVIDQTIWIFEKKEGKYLYGYSYAYIETIGYTKTKIYGSIIDGQVYMTFQNLSGNIITGIGKYEKCKFTMQMATTPIGRDKMYVTHSSYMIPITKKDKEWYKLPGTKIINGKYLSVKEFIDEANKNEIKQNNQDLRGEA